MHLILFIRSLLCLFFCHTVLQSVSNAWRMRWTAREKSPTTQVRDARLAAAAKPAAGMKWSQVTVHPESQPHTNTHTHIYSHSLTLWGCGWRASDRICCVCVFVHPVVCAGCGTATAVWGLFLFLLLLLFLGEGFQHLWSVSTGMTFRRWHPQTQMAPHLFFFFKDLQRLPPPQSISEVNHRLLIDTDSFNFISMCLLIMLTMYEGYVCGFECWVLIHPGTRASVLWTPPHCHRAEDCKSVLLQSIFNQDSLSLHIRNRHRIVDRDRVKTCITYYSQVRTELKRGMSGHD